MNCIGHRGLSALYPENTLPSFLAALDSGADGIEFDVRLTRDDEVVVIHDTTIDRTTNGKGTIRSMTWSQLQQFPAKRTHLGFNQCFGSDPSPSHSLLNNVHSTAAIPRLVDVLDMLLYYPRSNVFAVIDIKWDNPLSIMYHIRTLLEFPQYAPLLPRLTLGIWAPHFAWALPPPSVPVKRMFIGESLFLASTCSRSVTNYSLDFNLVLKNPNWVKRQKQNGNQISVWTVDAPSDLVSVMTQGLVDNVITDCAPVCLAVRDQFNAQVSASLTSVIPSDDMVNAVGVNQLVVAADS